MSLCAVVEFDFVSAEVMSAGDFTPESFGTRERNGTRNSYPVAKTNESTSDRAEPSSNITDVALKYAMGGLRVTTAPSGGLLPSLSD